MTRRRGRPVTEEERQQAVILYTHMGIREVAEQLDRSYVTARKMLKAAGVLRPHGSRPKAADPAGPATTEPQGDQ